MNAKQLLLTTLAVGIIANVLDFIVQGMILQRAYYARLSGVFREDAPVYWLIIGDFLVALVLVWVYDRVYRSFGGGAGNGARYGLYAGILVNFPTWLFLPVILARFPYGLAWIWTIYGVVFYVILGAVAGAMYRPGTTRA